MKTYKVTVHENGTYRWYNEQGQLHKENGPAVECADGSKEYWLNDKRHNENGPAIECADGSKEYWINGQRHNENGPAVEWSDGSKQYWLNGKLLRKQEFLDKTQAKELTVAEIEKLLGHKVKVVKEK